MGKPGPKATNISQKLKLGNNSVKSMPKHDTAPVKKIYSEEQKSKLMNSDANPAFKAAIEKESVSKKHYKNKNKKAAVAKKYKGDTMAKKHYGKKHDSTMAKKHYGKKY